MADTANVGKLVVDLLLKDDAFRKGMVEAMGTTQTTMPRVQAIASKAMGAVTAAFKAASVAVVGFGAASTAVGAKFEQQMAMVGALQGLKQTDVQFQQLQAQARKLGATTEFTATEAASALEELARAGATVSESIASSQSALELAGTSAASLADSTQLLVATQRQFGLEAEESKRITDVFSMAMRSSLLDFESLREAMKFAGTAGASFNMSLEETTASVAAFRDLGLEGSLAGTNFRMAMIAASQGTEKQAATLKKYGLTLADINPETNSFIDIVEKMGEVGLTASDAVALFGSRAGANVAQLAAQTRVGAVDMRKLTNELETSSEAGKDAASMYETIGQTVAFQTKLAVSALQDLMIEVFQTYAEPLKDLISTIPEVLNAVTAAVRTQAPELRAQFASALGGIAAFLRDNAQGLADAFVNTMQVLAQLGPMLSGIAQVLMVMAKNADALMVALSGAMLIGLAVKFGVAINGLALAFGATSTAVTVLGTTLTVTTGGLFAIVAAVGAAVVALGALVSKLMSARDHTQQLREAQEELEGRTTALANAEEKRLGAVLDAQQKRINERLMSGEELDAATRRRLESIQRLTAAEARQAVVQGRLVEMDGELVDARHLAKTGTDELRKTLLSKADAAAEDAKATASQVKFGNYYLESVRRATDEGAKALELRSAARAVGLKEDATLAQVTVRVQELAKVQSDQAMKAKNLRDRVAQGVADSVKTETRAEFDAQREIARAKGTAGEDTIAQREQHTKKIEKLMGRLVQASAKGAGDEVAARRAALNQQLADIDRAFGEAIVAEDRGLEQRMALADQHTEARRLAEQTAANEIQAIRDQEAQQAQAHAQQLAEQVRRATEGAASEAVRIERETQQTLAQLRKDGASEAQLMAVSAAGAERSAQARAQAEQAAQDTILKITGKGLSAREMLEREKAQSLADLVDASEGTRAQVVLAYDQQINRALRQGTVEAFAKAAQSAKAFGEAVAGAASGGIGAITGMLSSLTGFNFDLKAVIGDAMDAQQEALDGQADAAEAVADAQERLDEAMAGGDQAEIAEARAELATAKAELADIEGTIEGGLAGSIQTAVTDLIAGAGDFLGALVEGAPVALEALAAQLPALLTQVTEAIPMLVDALIAGVPPILFAVIDALPTLLDALLVGAVDLVTAVLQQLPAMLTQLLTEVVPSLLKTLGREIPRLLDAITTALPLILTAIIEAIPIVLGAVIELLPILIPALLEAVMKILASVAQAIPQLIGAVVSMLPKLVETLVGMIPDLIQAFVDNLPPLMTALLTLLPMVQIEVLKMLPDLAIALISAVFTELLPALPGLAMDLWNALVAGMGDAVKAIANAIGDAITDFFGLFKSGGKSGAFSGIGYVPATMRMTLHKGEAVIPADRNAQAAPGETAPAPAGAAQNGMGMGSAGGMPPIDIAVMAEGRLLDAVQVQAAKRGHATGVVKEIRRAGGVRVGLSRGRFSAFSSR